MGSADKAGGILARECGVKLFRGSLRRSNSGLESRKRVALSWLGKQGFWNEKMLAASS